MQLDELDPGVMIKSQLSDVNGQAILFAAFAAALQNSEFKENTRHFLGSMVAPR